MTKEQLGSLILDSERQLYSTAKTILFSDYDCADAIQETIVKAFSNVRFFYFCRSHTWPIGKDGVDSARKSSSAFSKNSTARLLVDFGYLCLIL